jgi:hypothetical protein
MNVLEDIRLEFMFVADGVHAINGKLYVLGGGWSHLWLPEFPSRAPIPFGVALVLQVPWNRTNVKLPWRLEVRDADGRPVGDEPVIAWGEFEQGRPPGLRPGADQRVVLAIPVNFEFPAAARYVFHVVVGDNDLGQTMIEVGEAPAGPAPPPPPEIS